MTEFKPKRTHMETISGRYLNLHHPDPADVCLDDIATALANACRWAAQCPYPYSVAEHACLVHDILVAWGEHPLICGAGLHHDDHEAYICDLATPVKNEIDPDGDGSYYRLGRRLDAAICRALGIDQALLTTPKVKEADAVALFVEAQLFKPSQGRHWNGRPVAPEEDVKLPSAVRWLPGDQGRAMTHHEAYNEFLLRAEK